MEGPEAADSAGDDYMTMDAENWLEHDDTYENGDDSGRTDGPAGHKSGPDSIQRKKERPQRPNPNTARPPVSERYLTIKRPPMNTNTGSGRKQSPQLVLYRRTTMCLVLLCILLLGGLLGLGFYSVQLHEILKEKNERLITLQRENNNLEQELGFLRPISRPIYRVSSKDDCSTGHDLFILNSDILEELKERAFFHLTRRNILTEERSIIYNTWNCTRTFPL